MNEMQKLKNIFKQMRDLDRERTARMLEALRKKQQLNQKRAA